MEAPVYSHFHYDIIPGQTTVVDRPDILIVEGLNVLQPARLPKDGEAIPFVSDFFNFSIYMDAEPQLIEDWYVTRFMRLRQTAFRDPAAYFHRYAHLTPDEARAQALEIWRSINAEEPPREHPAHPPACPPHPAQGRQPPHRDAWRCGGFDAAAARHRGDRAEAHGQANTSDYPAYFMGRSSYITALFGTRKALREHPTIIVRADRMSRPTSGSQPAPISTA